MRRNSGGHRPELCRPMVDTLMKRAAALDDPFAQDE